MMPGLDESDSSEYDETEETMGPTPDPELDEFVEVGSNLFRIAKFSLGPNKQHSFHYKNLTTRNSGSYFLSMMRQHLLL